MIALWVALAGGLGAATRLVLDGATRARVGGDFPWATMLINVTGSLLLGVLTGLVLFHGQPSAWRTVAGTGFCGGYTTFSTASVETVRLLQRGARWSALANGVGSAVLTLAAGGLGLLLAH